jgi:Arc/MetJ family transcription regulator
MTLDVDPDLLRQALEETGTTSKSAVVEMGLRALLGREARRRLKDLYGKVPDLKVVRRRS